MSVEPYEIPESWEWTLLSKVCSINTGKRDVNEGAIDGKYKFFTCASEPLKSNTYSFDGESILLPGNGANVGMAFYFNGKFEAYQRTYVLNNFPLNTKYIYNHLLGFWKAANLDKQYGSATNYIRMNNLTEYQIPIAPREEQDRIVEKIESLFSKIESGQTQLEKLPKLLKQFRQTVLAAACSGRLVSQDPNDEPASELLKRIQAERKSKWEADLIAKGKDPKKLKYPEPESIDTSDFPELPDGWAWTSLGELVLGAQNGLSKRYSKEGKPFPVLRLADFEQDTINYSRTREIPLNDDEIKKYKLFNNDVLIIRVNGSRDIVGRFYISETIETHAFCDHLIRVKFSENIHIPYLKIILQTKSARNFIDENMVSSAGQNTISQITLFKIPIPLPPYPEQKLIAEFVENGFKKVINTSSYAQKLNTASKQLKQTILSKAFRGELVEQDPNDESASILLERIRAERALNKKPVTSGKKKKSSKEKQLVEIS